MRAMAGAVTAGALTGYQGLLWLRRRETLRVSKLWTQTVLAPVVSSLLFILVFGLSLGSRIREVAGFPYEVFVVPGLIVMAMVQAAYNNNASTIFQARSDRYVNDVLSAPMRPWQMNLGFNVGGAARALAIGGALLALSIPLTGVPIEQPFVLVAAVLLGVVLFGALGTVVGIYAETVGPHDVHLEHRDPSARLRRRRLLLRRPARLAMGADLAREPGLLPGELGPLRRARHERRERRALARRNGRARDPGLSLVAAPVHERAPVEGLSGRADPVDGLAALERRVVDCRKCPRLVEWRERVAREKRASYASEDYWGRPVPGFGDPRAAIYVLGLAPAAHGGNRTGRVFTGDRSADWLYASMHRLGLASQATSIHPGDGLELRGAFVAAAVRCAPPANRPLPSERDNCLPYAAEELRLLDAVRVVVCLGGFAWDAAARLCGVRPRPRFGHGAEHRLADGPLLLGSYHPSQQNTFTGKLTERMLDDVFVRARALAGL